MRLFGQVSLLVSRDSDQRQKLADVDVVHDVVDATVDKFHGETIVLAAAEADTPVSFGSLTSASTVLLVAYDTVQVRLNDVGAPLLDLVPVSAVPEGSTILSTFQRDDQPGVAYWRGKITSIFLTNPSTTDEATVYVALAGDAA